MLGKIFDRVLQEDEEYEMHRVEKEAGPKKDRSSTNSILWIYTIPVIVFLLALLPRLVYLFYFTDPFKVGPNWYGDVYHHWQIAILSKDVGFKQGFLRLWDFKGLEYYWGLLHPLVVIIGFVISGSTSILVPRMISVLFGSLSVVLVYLIIYRHFNIYSAILSAAFASLLPVSLFSDTLGMQEPLGFFFLLLGIYIWPKYAFWTGFVWMLAGMERSEYWLFGIGLVISVLLKGKNSQAKIFLVVGYIIPFVLYMKYLLDYTGNPIYPIYHNFLATVVGKWFIKEGVILSTKVQLIKTISQIISVASIVSGLAILLKRPRGYLFFLVGLASISHLSFVFGFGSYLYGYPEDGIVTVIDRNFVDRLVVWPYIFIASMLSIFLLYFLPRFLPKVLRRAVMVLGSLVLAVLLLLSQISWLSINYHYSRAMGPLEGDEVFAGTIAKHYKGQGNILLPEGRATLTYYLIDKEKIPAERLISQLYNPFYYYEGGDDPFQNWGEFRLEIFKWLIKTDAELAVLTGNFAPSENSDNFVKAVLREEKYFELLEDNRGTRVYRVKLDEIEQIVN